MNRKILFALALSAALLTSIFVGIAASFREKNPEYVSYRFEAVLSNATTTTLINPPIVTIEGYRPAIGIQSANLTINGVLYTYPDDFNYNETFKIEHNQVTGKGILVVTTVYTFNLPGNPTISDYMTAAGIRNATGAVTWTNGVFFLTGTGQFRHVDGGGFIESTQASGVDYARHIGLIKGWPL